MNKNIVKMVTVLALFSLLVFATPATFANFSVQSNKPNSENATNLYPYPPNTPTFSIKPQSDLFYHIDQIQNGTYHYLNVTNDYNQPAGKIVEGNMLAYNFQGAYDNNSYNYLVNGSVKSSTLTQDLPYQVALYNSLGVGVNQGQGGPMFLSFIIPTNTNFTLMAHDYNISSPSFSSTTTPTTFNINTSTTINSDNLSLNISWDVNTGIMQYYNMTTVSNTNPTQVSKFVLSYNTTVDYGSLNPYFAYNNPGMFYNIKTLQVGTSNQIKFNQTDDPNSGGYFEQGQNTFVSLQTDLTNITKGPSIFGEINTLTGHSSIDNAYNQSNNNNGPSGPPALFFLFPISNDAGWWSNVSLDFSVSNMNKISDANGLITFYLSFPQDPNYNVTLTLNKTDGVLVDYKFQADMYPLPNNQYGVFRLELKLSSVYEMPNLYPSFGPIINRQFKYHIDTLNINGQTAVPADQGNFQQGQDLNILFNQLNLNNGPHALTTLSTITGQSKNNVNFDFLNPQNGNSSALDGPALFFPAIPINQSSRWFSFLNDTFSLVVGATVTDNASVFGIQVTNLAVGQGVTVNHLIINWNKTNGLLINYDFDASNSTQSIKLKVHYLSESTGQTVFNPSSSTETTLSSTTTSSGNTLTTSPGFELVMFTAVFVAVGLVSRKRRKQH